MSTQTDRPYLDVEDAGQVCPSLSDFTRRHLGRLLAAAYEDASIEASATERFAGLLARLGAALDDASLRDATVFRAELLAVIPSLRRFAISLNRDPISADDLVQDTLLRAWRARGTFQIGTNFEAWTFTILRNQFYTTQRKPRELPDEDGEQAARLCSPPEQDGHLDLADVRSALGRLSAPMREVLTLVTVENLSYEEVAAVMNCRVGTVKSRVWRAREQLAQMLGYDGSEVGSDGLLLSAMERSGRLNPL